MHLPQVSSTAVSSYSLHGYVTSSTLLYPRGILYYPGGTWKHWVLSSLFSKFFICDDKAIANPFMNKRQSPPLLEMSVIWMCASIERTELKVWLFVSFQCVMSELLVCEPSNWLFWDSHKTTTDFLLGLRLVDPHSLRLVYFGMM